MPRRKGKGERQGDPDAKVRADRGGRDMPWLVTLTVLVSLATG